MLFDATTTKPRVDSAPVNPWRGQSFAPTYHRRMAPESVAAYTHEDVAEPWSEQLLDWGTDFHDLLLGDALRMRAYRSALAEVVHPGDVVVDLGTGTGVLARWAIEAGATRAYGVERDAALLERARAAADEAGLGDRFVPVAGLSFDVELPEPADLVVSEILGNLVDNEGCGPILADARARFLRPGGRLLPHRVERYLVPVEAPRAHAAVASRGGRAFDAYYDVILPRTGYLASPRADRAFDAGVDVPAYETRLVFAVDRAGVFTGFKGWFVADLSDTVVLDIAGDHVGTGPGDRTSSDSWRHAFLPVARPVAVEPHDRIVVTLSRSVPPGAGPFAQSYRWAGEVRRGRAVVAAFAQRT